jgi:hypothetical protein
VKTTVDSPPRDFTYIKTRKARLSEYEAVNCFAQPDPDVLGPEGWFLRTAEGRPLWLRDSTRLEHPRWFDFRDPAGLWQRTYVKLQAEQERAVELAVEGGVTAGVFTDVNSVWLRELLGRHYRVWTYFEYGVFRACAQAQREALSDTLGGVLCFEAVDRMRHAQDIILYLMNVEKAVAGFADDGAKAEWLNEPLYQPARKMTEEIMALNDWGELAVAVNLVIDPLFSEVGLSQLIRRSAPYHGDSITPMLVLCAERDRQRNLAWTVELVKMVTAPELEQCEQNRRTIQDWIVRWSPLALQATEALAPVFERVPTKAVQFSDALRLARELQAGTLSQLGFTSL